MYAGLVTDKSTGKTYLLNTEHDGTYGRMLSIDGQYMVNGKSIYLTFNQNHDGTFGAITSGLSELRSTGVKESTRDSIPTDNAEEITEQPNTDAEITDNTDVSSKETENTDDSILKDVGLTREDIDRLMEEMDQGLGRYGNLH